MCVEIDLETTVVLPIMCVTIMNSNILESFKCCIDDIRQGIAYIIIKSEQTNEIFYGQYDAQKLKDAGIERYFCCKTIRQSDGKIILKISPLPQVMIPPERLKEIEKQVDDALSEYLIDDDY